MGEKPPFTVSPKAISMIAEISALTERYAIHLERHDSLKLRKANQIKTIQSSLAIEGNTLTENQVTDILDGKRVVAPLREIQEVRNAIATYDLFPKLDPFSINDLLKAHGVMMSALVDDAGQFRHGGVGVFAGKQPIHIAPPAERVPGLIANLFDWLKHAEDHLLIRSCVFHYEFELIHPFADGNGRVGRLWHTLLLSKWNPAFAWLPVESIIHDRQEAYYAAINASNGAGESTVFIEFMLSAIKASLMDAINTSDEMSDEVMDKAAMRWKQIEKFLQTHEYIMNADVRVLCGVSAATANRILAGLAAEGTLVKYREGGHWAYKLRKL